METRPDGTEIQTDTAGNRLETFPDGRRTQTDVEGNRVEEFPDGMRIKTFANAYRYWGPLRDDLAAVDETPGQLAPGGRLRVTGAVHSDPEDLMAAVFRLPDGSVFEIPAERVDGRFSCVFPESVFTTPGHYRIQVRAQRTGGSVVMADRALVVGNPPPLEKMVLAVMPFRGADDARDRFEKMVHARYAAASDCRNWIPTPGWSKSPARKYGTSWPAALSRPIPPTQARRVSPVARPLKRFLRS